MNTPSAAGSLIADRAIGTKVGIGFACVLAILAVVSATAYLSFQTSADGLHDLCAAGVGGRDRPRRRRSFLNVRRYRARLSHPPASRATSRRRKRNTPSLQPLLQRGLAEIKNPERHRLLDDVARNFEAYLKDFGQLVAQTREQRKLIEATLDPLAPACCSDFDTLIAAAAKAGDGNVAGARQ